jgi:ankyrin repeat protein
MTSNIWVTKEIMVEKLSAVTNRSSLCFLAEIVRRIMKARPWLAREENGDKFTPMCKALLTGKTDILTVLLENDPSLGYLLSSNIPPLVTAAAAGHVGTARELLKHCPDTPYCDATGWTCLHAAVRYGRMEFVQFLLGSKQLPPLVNMQYNGRSALHVAAQRPNSGIISALLLHQGIDITLLNNRGQTARQALPAAAKDKEDSIWV